MFTGIITDVAEVSKIEPSDDNTKIWLKTSYELEPIEIGASIACNGCCLTVVSKNNDLLEFDISNETIKRTNFSSLKLGSKLNLEQSLAVTDRLGGHIVTGHVDDVLEVVELKKGEDNWQVSLETPKEYSKFIAEKGSVTINGASLTVNYVENDVFKINIIPHTLSNTNLDEIEVGHQLNFEVDLLARYIERQLNYDK